MAHEKRPLAYQPSPDAPVPTNKTEPPSPPLTSSSSPSLSPLPQPLVKIAKASRLALPPSVAGAYRCLQEARRGRYTGPSWVRFLDVGPDDLEALLSATQSFEYRFDYEPSTQQLTLRMPEGAPHIYTKNGFAQSILRGLEARIHRAIQEEDSQASTCLRTIKVKVNVEDKVQFASGGIKRPDVAFSFKGSRYPPLVAEIGHSQKAKSLATDAREYIDKTDGAIHTVITARFTYLDADQRRKKRWHARDEQSGEQKQATRRTRSQTRQHGTGEEATLADVSAPAITTRSKSAHISLYRLGRRVLHDQEFRNAQGQPQEGGLELNVADFVPWGEQGEAQGAATRAKLEQLNFTIPFSEFCESLKWGEEQQLLEEQTPVPDAQPASAGRKRVHFEWSDPEPTPEAEDTDDHTESNEEAVGGSSSSSKRRRINLEDTPYRAARSSQQQQSDVAQARRRSSSRLSQRRSQSEEPPSPQVVTYRRRRSSSRLSEQARGVHGRRAG